MVPTAHCDNSCLGLVLAFPACMGGWVPCVTHWGLSGPRCVAITLDCNPAVTSATVSHPKVVHSDGQYIHITQLAIQQSLVVLTCQQTDHIEYQFYFHVSTILEPNYASNNKSEHHITYAAPPHHSYLPAWLSHIRQLSTAWFLRKISSYYKRSETERKLTPWMRFLPRAASAQRCRMPCRYRAGMVSTSGISTVFLLRNHHFHTSLTDKEGNAPFCDIQMRFASAR